jgi:hypothetical protein
LFDFRRDASGRRGPVVLDGEVQRVFSILVQKHKKSPSADPEDLLNVFSFYFFLEIAFEKLLDLI